MVLPAVVLGVEVVLGLIGIGTTVAGAVSSHKAANEMKKEQKKAAVEQLEIKVLNDLVSMPNAIPAR
jgi:hypothetical protein